MVVQFRVLIILALGSLLLIEGVLAQYESKVVMGKVFLDRNRNNQLDAFERGLKKIWVSNGDTIVQTNKKGEYLIRVKKGQILFPIIPSKYTSQAGLSISWIILFKGLKRIGSSFTKSPR